MQKTKTKKKTKNTHNEVVANFITANSNGTATALVVAYTPSGKDVTWAQANIENGKVRYTAEFNGKTYRSPYGWLKAYAADLEAQYPEYYFHGAKGVSQLMEFSPKLGVYPHMVFITDKAEARGDHLPGYDKVAAKYRNMAAVVTKAPKAQKVRRGIGSF